MQWPVVDKMLDSLSRIRFGLAKPIYRAILSFLVRDETWQENFFAFLTPKPGERILNLGLHSSSSALALAHRYPAATFIAIEGHSRTVAKMQRRGARKQLRNFDLIEAPDDNRLPFEAGRFDRVVCMLGIHDRPPEAKLAFIKEIARVLRRGGTMNVVDFDKPENRGEERILGFARSISGWPAVAPHADGSWVDIFGKNGFAGVRRLSSYSIGIGRLSVVKARKR